MPRHQKSNCIIIKDVNQKSRRWERSLSDSTNHHQKTKKSIIKNHHKRCESIIKSKEKPPLRFHESSSESFCGSKWMRHRKSFTAVGAHFCCRRAHYSTHFCLHSCTPLHTTLCNCAEHWNKHFCPLCIVHKHCTMLYASTLINDKLQRTLLACECTLNIAQCNDICTRIL